jgi:hypothetical protein
MNYSRNNLILDIIATSLSVLILPFLYVNSKVSGGIDWEMVVFDLITGLAAYWITLILFKNKPKFAGIPMIVYAVILGSIVWAVCHISYLFYFDWRYLSDIRPESFYQRNFRLVTDMLPWSSLILTLNALIFISLWRLAKKIPELIWWLIKNTIIDPEFKKSF